LRHGIERIPWRSLFWLALAAVTVLALIPWGEEIPRPFRWSAKLHHFAAVILLANLMLEAYRPGAWRTVALLTLYGALIEGIQSFLPWRSAEWGDLGVDLLAASAGVLLWTLLRNRGLDADRR
jgi:VanZ family protein